MSLNKDLRAITDFPNYKVSSDGRVFNDDNRELKQTKNQGGYFMVKLCDRGYEKNCSVHRLVAKEFIDNPDNKPCVNHIDCDKTNNNVSNLEWCTYGENEKHAYYNNLRRSHLTNDDRKKGARISGDKSSKPVRVKETGNVYPSVNECARQLNGYKNAISNCCNGKATHHHGYHFEWAEECEK